MAGNGCMRPANNMCASPVKKEILRDLRIDRDRTQTHNTTVMWRISLTVKIMRDSHLHEASNKMILFVLSMKQHNRQTTPGWKKG